VQLIAETAVTLMNESALNASSSQIDPDVKESRSGYPMKALVKKGFEETRLFLR
jgi:hypothetical protein